MGASGSVQYLYDAFHWKDASEQPVADLDRTTTLAFTDLDLTAYTSSVARIAILQLSLHVDSIAGGTATLGIRKNGTTPVTPKLYARADTGDAAGAITSGTVLCGMDAGQVIEYTIIIAGTVQVDSYIDVLGYIE